MKVFNDISFAQKAHCLVVLLRSFVPIIVMAALLIVGIPHGRAMIAEPRLKSESQIRSEANLYDTAIREISRVETMTMATVDDFKPVRAILEKRIPNLKFNRSKLVSIGFGESTFVSAVKARASDKAKAEEFARELAADNQSIFRLNGAQSLKDKINQSVRNDISMLRRVSERMQRAADEIRAKSPAHHVRATSRSMDSCEFNFQRGDGLEIILMTPLIISVAMIVGGPMAAVALFSLATAVAGAVVTAAIVAGAAVLVGRIVANVGTEEGRDRLAECMRNVDARYAQCVQQGGVLLTPLCLAQYVANALRCITAE